MNPPGGKIKLPSRSTLLRGAPGVVVIAPVKPVAKTWDTNGADGKVDEVSTNPTPAAPTPKKFERGVPGVVWVTLVEELYPVTSPITAAAGKATVKAYPTFVTTRFQPEPTGFDKQRPV